MDSHRDIVQWGSYTASGTHYFPVAHSSVVYSIVACKKDDGTNSVPDIRNYSTTTFSSQGPPKNAWISVGV